MRGASVDLSKTPDRLGQAAQEARLAGEGRDAGVGVGKGCPEVQTHREISKEALKHLRSFFGWPGYWDREGVGCGHTWVQG